MSSERYETFLREGSLPEAEHLWRQLYGSKPDGPNPFRMALEMLQRLPFQLANKQFKDAQETLDSLDGPLRHFHCEDTAPYRERLECANTRSRLEQQLSKPWDANILSYQEDLARLQDLVRRKSELGRVRADLERQLGSSAYAATDGDAVRRDVDRARAFEERERELITKPLEQYCGIMQNLGRMLEGLQGDTPGKELRTELQRLRKSTAIEKEFPALSAGLESLDKAIECKEACDKWATSVLESLNGGEVDQARHLIEEWRGDVGEVVEKVRSFGRLKKGIEVLQEVEALRSKKRFSEALQKAEDLPEPIHSLPRYSGLRESLRERADDKARCLSEFKRAVATLDHGTGAIGICLRIARLSRSLNDTRIQGLFGQDDVDDARAKLEARVSRMRWWQKSLLRIFGYRRGSP